MLSISTSWFNGEISLTDWLRRVQSYGYEAVELSYKVTQKELDEAAVAIGNLGLKVSSIHNFCPTPDDGLSTRHISNYYRLSSLDEEERRLAIKWTKKAIDTANAIGAPVVIIHAGTLDFEDERAPKLFELFTSGHKNTDDFTQERERILKLREVKKAPYLQVLEQSLSKLTLYASNKNVQIGLETRYYPLEIPNFEEIGYFLSKFDQNVMGYWHDVGHAEINGRLGIKPHREFLETYKDRLIGVHIHGMNGRRDHLAPFEGDLDLKQYLPYFSESIIKVVESKPFANPQLIEDAVSKLS